MRALVRIGRIDPPTTAMVPRQRAPPSTLADWSPIGYEYMVGLGLPWVVRAELRAGSFNMNSIRKHALWAQRDPLVHSIYQRQIDKSE